MFYTFLVLGLVIYKKLNKKKSSQVRNKMSIVWIIHQFAHMQNTKTALEGEDNQKTGKMYLNLKQICYIFDLR